MIVNRVEIRTDEQPTMRMRLVGQECFASQLVWKGCKTDAFVLCHHEGIANQQVRHSACIHWCQGLLGTLGVSMFTDLFVRRALRQDLKINIRKSNCP